MYEVYYYEPMHFRHVFYGYAETLAEAKEIVREAAFSGKEGFQVYGPRRIKPIYEE